MTIIVQSQQMENDISKLRTVERKFDGNSTSCENDTNGKTAEYRK